jgi:Gram-negative porin
MRRGKSVTRAAWVAALGTAVLLAVTAGAQAGGYEPCCADLEARVSDLEATTVRKGNRRVSLKVSGFLNEAIMQWNDGFERNVYFVTNETERSRVKFELEVKLTSKWSVGGLLELGIHIDPQGKLDQNVAHSLVSRMPDTRYSYWFVKNEDLGKLDIGRTRTATYHIADMMDTQTWYFAKYGIGSWIGANGNGFFLRKTDGTLLDGANALRWGDIDAHAATAAPGQGERQDAVHYQTPKIAGFVASAAYGGAGVADIALRYTGGHGDFKILAGIGYGDYSRFDARRCAVLSVARKVRCRDLGMSGSLMHVPSGLYLLGSYGAQWDLNAPILFQAPVDDLSSSYYVQAGIERKFFDAGKTTIFAEFEHDEVGAGIDATNGGILDTTALGPSPLAPGTTSYNRMAASEIDTWGLGVGQSVLDEALLLYISGRYFSADVYTSATGLKAGAVKTELEDFLMIVGGAKVTF